MGQYYKVVNLTKKEYLNPHDFDDGAKLMEFGQSSGGTMASLAILLANSNGRGGGDADCDDMEWVGRWAGDEIIIAGDYAEKGDKKEDQEENIYSLCSVGDFRNISSEVSNAFRKELR